MDTVALKDDPELPLQLAPSRLLDKAGRDESGSILYEVSMGTTCRRVEMTGDRRQNWGKERKKTMVLDGDGLPVEIDGRPSGSEWNGHYHQQIYHVENVTVPFSCGFALSREALYEN